MSTLLPVPAYAYTAGVTTCSGDDSETLALALISLEARALDTMRRYDERPLKATRRALLAYRSLLADLGRDGALAMVDEALWFRV